MSNHLTDSVLLVGTGPMAAAYAKVLKALEQPFHVAGRSADKAASFAAEWDVPVGSGDFAAQLAAIDKKPHTAIVAASVASLVEVCRALVAAGCKRILLEKPATLSPEETTALAQEIGNTAEIYVAYNRRFYAATERAREIISFDGGVLSFKFDFTEASKRIEAINKPAVDLANWFYGNSTHVVDLAFFVGGSPISLSANVQEEMPWHPAGAVFTGHGRADSGAAFSYHANWLAPGRWGVEVMTQNSRLVLQPMEQLFRQGHEGFSLEPVAIDDELDKTYKPGVYRQTEAFLSGKADERLLSLAGHAGLSGAYRTILSGGNYHHDR
jgi:predicted dehydrogenase